MHFVLPAMHFACWAEAGPEQVSTSVVASAITIERIIIEFTPLQMAIAVARSLTEGAVSSQAIFRRTG